MTFWTVALLVAHTALANEYRCAHTHEETLQLSWRAESEFSVRAATQRSSFRIVFDHSRVTWSDTTMQKLWISMFASMQQTLSTMLKVDPVSPRLFLSPPCVSLWTSGVDSGKCAEVKANLTCGTTMVPQADLTSTVCDGSGKCTTKTGSGGIDGDMIMYVTADVNQAGCQSVGRLAYAAPCQLDSSTDRPLAGFMNICQFGTQSESLLISKLILHEVTHALAFSPGLFPYFRNPDGTPRVARGTYNQPIANATFLVSSYSATLGHSTLQIQTEKVVAEGRRHFNCATLSGVELDSDSRAHWSQRVLQSEYMCPSISDSMAVPVSRLTMALLEDSGWYDVNYDTAQPLAFGRNQGCGFTSSRCVAGAKTSPTTNSNQYCAPPDVLLPYSDCSYDRIGFGYCALTTYTAALPSPFQYFANPLVGGDSIYRDYCPIVPALDTNCTSPSFSLTAGQSFGETSLCFRSSIQNISSATSPTDTPRCYRNKCVGGVLQILISSLWVSCPTNGGAVAVTVAGMSGTIICPQAIQLCYDSATIDSTPSPSLSPSSPPSDGSGINTAGLVAGILFMFFFLSTVAIGIIIKCHWKEPILNFFRRLFSRRNRPDSTTSEGAARSVVAFQRGGSNVNAQSELELSATGLSIVPTATMPPPSAAPLPAAAPPPSRPPPQVPPKKPLPAPPIPAPAPPSLVDENETAKKLAINSTKKETTIGEKPPRTLPPLRKKNVPSVQGKSPLPPPAPIGPPIPPDTPPVSTSGAEDLNPKSPTKHKNAVATEADEEKQDTVDGDAPEIEKKAEKIRWLRYLTDDGEEYFYNQQSEETVWERPSSANEVISDG